MGGKFEYALGQDQRTVFVSRFMYHLEADMMMHVAKMIMVIPGAKVLANVLAIELRTARKRNQDFCYERDSVNNDLLLSAHNHTPAGFS